MGISYTQAILKGPSQQDVADYLSSGKHCASIGPTIDSYTILSDRACEVENLAATDELCSSLSQHFECPCLGIHYFDEYVLAYHLFDHGTFLDEYVSGTDYFDFSWSHAPARPAIGGDKVKLGNAFGLRQDQVDAAQRALHERIRIEMPEDLPASVNDMLSAYGSGNTAEFDRMRDQLSNSFDNWKSTKQKPIDTRPPAQLHFEQVIKAMGIPGYAMHFRYGAKEEFHDLPPGSIITVGE